MKPLPVNIMVDEKKLLGDIKFSPTDVFSLYESSGDQEHFYILADSNNPKKICMVVNKELWSILFEQRGVRFNMNKW